MNTTKNTRQCAAFVLSSLSLFKQQQQQQRGFTLVELVTVLILIGILAVVALPRMPDRAGFEARGFYDTLLSSLQYAQKMAVAKRRAVCVSIMSANQVLMNYASNANATSCAANDPVLSGPDGQPFVLSAPAGVTITASVNNVIFFPSGSANGSATFLVTQLTGKTITVEEISGYVSSN